MSAGLPGIGLGGLFFICSALVAPFAELARIARGESSPERRARVAGQLAMAVAMLLAIQATLLCVRLVAGTPTFVLAGFPLVTLALLGVVLGVSALAALVSRLRARRRRYRRRAEWALLGSNQ